MNAHYAKSCIAAKPEPFLRYHRCEKMHSPLFDYKSLALIRHLPAIQFIGASILALEISMKRSHPGDSSPLSSPLRPAKASRLDLDDPLIIANNFEINKLLSQKHVPYGLQFELARAINEDTRAEYVKRLKKLTPVGPRTHVELLPLLLDTTEGVISAREVASSAPWQELDKEDEAFLQDPSYGGIGNNPAYPDWWAGKVDFRGKLDEQKDRITLEKPTLGPSNKIQRRFGSASILRVKVPSKRFYTRNNGLVKLFKRPVIIWDHVFRAFYAKEGTVFFLRTNETMEGYTFIKKPSGSGMSLYDFIQWMNPLSENQDQKLCKWASRMALGLSSSVPGPRLDQSDITKIDDIFRDRSDPSSNQTDGCGLATLSLHKQVYDTFRDNYRLEGVPTAMQIRIAGAKGLVLVDRRIQSENPQIQLRDPSQIKINYGSTASDLSHLTLDILRFSRTKTPARLSEETIKCLHHNGVLYEVFVGLLEAHLREVVESLTAWEGPNAMQLLWKAAEAAEGVVSARRARESLSDSRQRGLGDRKEEDDDDDDIGSPEGGSVAWWRDPVSGCPSPIAETVIELLDSGFTPMSSPYLRNKLKQLVKMKVNSSASKFNYVVPQSGGAFVVPDPYSVLGSDEIQFRSSRKEFVTGDGTKTDIVLGQVLITRNPCKVPTDVRKVTAVEHPDLRELVDVIVCSVKGYRRLLDFLAGGDYDGDRALVIWDSHFVLPFKNANERFSLTPKGIETAFYMDKRTVGDFCRQMRTRNTPEERQVSELQKYLLASLLDPSFVGEYSRFHENAIYKLGYGHWKTVRLGYIFCIVLDSAKTGHRLLQKTHDTDRTAYYHSLGPDYKRKLDAMKKDSPRFASNELPLAREVNAPFIIDILCEEAEKQRSYWLQVVDKRFESAPQNGPDPDLTAPWRDIHEMAQKRGLVDMLSDLKMISDHVESLYVQKQQAYSQHPHFSSQPITTRQDTNRDLSMRFAAKPTVAELRILLDETLIARLKASYAYIHACLKGGTASQFPFDRAFRELCSIKAQATGYYKTCVLTMYEQRK